MQICSGLTLGRIAVASAIPAPRVSTHHDMRMVKRHMHRVSTKLLNRIEGVFRKGISISWGTLWALLERT